MEWEESFKLDLLQSEMDRIASTNKTYLRLDAERQQILKQLRDHVSHSEYELVERLADVMELQNFLMIRAVLRIGSI